MYKNPQNNDSDLKETPYSPVDLAVDTSAKHDAHLRKQVGPEFMARFKCLESECPDTCCNGWKVPVTPDRYRKMRAGLIRAGRRDPGPAATGTQGLSLPVNSNGCLLQCASGLCTVHTLLGEDALPQVCADFPRLINRIDDRFEVTGDIACPEVARLLLTESGSERIVELPDSVMTQFPAQGLSTQGTAPYVRVFNEVRGFIITLLSLAELTPTERMVAVHVFCAHTITQFHEHCTERDLDAIAKIMDHLSDTGRIRALVEMVMKEPVSGKLAVPILNHVVRLGSAIHPDFEPLGAQVLPSYETNKKTTDYDGIWAGYELRRAMVRARLGHRIDEAFWRMAYHDWVHSPYVLSPSLTSHAVSLQLPLAVTRWLLFGQPEVVDALSHSDDERLQHTIDSTLVHVAYKAARAIRHSNLLKVAQEIFDDLGLDDASAALLLARL